MSELTESREKVRLIKIMFSHLETVGTTVLLCQFLLYFSVIVRVCSLRVPCAIQRHWKMNEKAQTETFDSDKTFKHSDIRIFKILHFGKSSRESELSGVFWPRGHIKSVRLSESPTYPGYDLNEIFWRHSSRVG